MDSYILRTLSISNDVNDVYVDVDVHDIIAQCKCCDYVTNEINKDCIACKMKGCMMSINLTEEDIMNCDLCCVHKNCEKYYLFKRGRKQELFSCIKCFKEMKNKLNNEGWKWIYYVNEEEVDRQQEEKKNDELILKNSKIIT